MVHRNHFGESAKMVEIASAVMPGLVPGIHAGPPLQRRRMGRSGSHLPHFAALHAGVDGRDKPGHDAGLSPKGSELVTDCHRLRPKIENGEFLKNIRGLL